MNLRAPAVAGSFYPAAESVLRQQVQALLAAVAVPPDAPAPQALIVPHAGYVYSGPVAASAYARLRGHRYARVVLLGPAHRLPLSGIALSPAEGFRTPLGTVAADRTVVQRLAQIPGVALRADAHALEHSLEVQLPFLQCLLTDFAVVAAVVGQATPALVEAFLREAVDAHTLVVLSTDLSHYHGYAQARALDARTASRIESFDATLGGDEACGAFALNGLLRYAAARGWHIARLDLRNSGDTAGGRDRVVGYASFALA